MDYATATTKGSIHIDDEDDEEEEVCRICRIPGDHDADNPLRYPCACSGSIKFVHEDCLLHWLTYSRSRRRCEVCKHSFSFSPLYAENAPARLPFRELVAGAAVKACSSSRVPRLSLVLSLWLLAVPLVTFWMWRLCFLRCFGQLLLSHVSAADCLFGFVLSASIMFVLCEATSLRGYFRHLRVSLYEVVGMDGPLFRLVENAFSVLASNLLFLGAVIFVPFTLGRVILYYFADTTGLNNVLLNAVSNGLFGQLTEMLKLKVNGSELSGAINNTLFVAAGLSSTLYDVTTLSVGYMFIVFLVFFYLGITAVIRYFKGEPLTVGGVYGIGWIGETVSPLLGQFLVVMRVGFRVASFVVVMFGVFPLMCGWWLDVCTVMMFGQTMSYRLEFLSVSPLASSLVHWVVGAMYDWYLLILENLLREVLRPEVLYILYGPEDDEDESIRYYIYDPVHKLARDALFFGAQYGSWIVLLVFLPSKLAIWMAPSIFPLDISVSDPFTEIPAGIVLLTICTPFIIEHFRVETTVVSLLRCWFTCVGWALGLTDFLLPKPEDNAGQDNGNAEPGQNIEQVLDVGGPDMAVAALPVADGPNRSLLQEYNFQLRIILLILVAWVTLLLVHSTLIVVPVSLGRTLFNAIPVLPITHGIKCNDLYAFFIGTYAFWTTISSARCAVEHVKSERSSVLLSQIWKWCGIVIKSSVLLGIWVLIIPVLIGLLFDLLVIVPIRVPVDESPVFLLYQDWALGLIFTNIWTRLVMLQIVDDSWRAKFERVKEDGFSRLQGLWVLREIVLPIVMKLLTALCVPYVLARGVFPMLGCPLVVNSAVYRFAWIGCLTASLLCFCAKRCHVWFRDLHDSIRDDRYIIGQRLHNSGEEAALAIKESQSSEVAGDR
ncbi:putative E3 ubiquitin ligase SUD1 [Raphanus sativus]|uniref:Probable E3 ubiquitin ligase SUD1 n=1 Tax=Raphanus sativus TaxID=3726 RepID=A0A9W3DL95_RAPSA|nr:probable E3 ubiquitin ligase SUD1 [Raphanus sativus]KAJ4898989.1 putative E3 ubiquitin ligase SUD1 [Raphanus sativus]